MTDYIFYIKNSPLFYEWGEADSYYFRISFRKKFRYLVRFSTTF